MTQSLPQTTKAWRVVGRDGFDNLKWETETPIPELGTNDVLVKFHAASLNYRDLMIPQGKYPFPYTLNNVPGSDGAGEVLAIGTKVTRFTTGSKVLTLFNQGHFSASLDPVSIQTGLGGTTDGTLRQYGVFNESGLVAMPSTLTYEEGATLPCAAVTAWNALYYGPKPLKAGDVVLTQGTGSFSIFALQFAKVAGATVIATTSSAAKAAKLKALGADYTINYRETPDWGAIAKALTPNGVGVDHIMEVGGPDSIAQSLDAIKLDGTITLVGYLAGPKGKNDPSFLECLSRICIVRGIFVGSRDQFEDMNRAIEGNGIKPVIEEKIFPLEELKDAYQYMWDQKHFGKLVISIQ